jgi:K+ transporter
MEENKAMQNETRENMLAVVYGLIAALLIGGATIAFALLVTSAIFGFQILDPVITLLQAWVVVGMGYTYWAMR